MWIYVILGVFVVGTVFIIMAKPFNEIEDKVYPSLDPDYQPTALKAKSMFNNFPIFMILGLILMGIIASIKKGHDGGFL